MPNMFYYGVQGDVTFDFQSMSSAELAKCNMTDLTSNQNQNANDCYAAIDKNTDFHYRICDIKKSLSEIDFVNSNMKLRKLLTSRQKSDLTSLWPILFHTNLFFFIYLKCKSARFVQANDDYKKQFLVLLDTCWW